MPDAADELSRTPVPDPAEDNAYFPSPYSLSQYVPSKTDFTGVQYENAYTGGRWKILMIATEERYMLMQKTPCSRPETIRWRCCCRCTI